MALKGTTKGKVTQNSSHYSYYMQWVATQSIAGNYTDITVWHYWTKDGTTTFDSTAERDYGIVIDGTTYSGTKRMDYNPWPSDATISTATKRIYHNPDGSKSITISTYANGRAGSYGPSSSSEDSGDCTASATITFDTIPRAASITGAPHFTDEENPTITYSNPAGTAVTKLQACIANSAGTTVFAAYRDIDKSGTSYTFNLTEAEREALRWATINSNTLTVKFYVTTTIGDQIYYSTLDKILTIANANPTLNPTVKDTGGYSTPLTGDANKIIKGFNYVTVSSGAAALKGASIKSQKITCGGQVIEAGSGGFSNVESNVFEFSATDSRGNTTTKTVTKEMIPYVKLSCNLAANNPTAEGDMALKISGNYYNGSFGAQNNTLEVYWRFKENDGEYGEWTKIEPSISNNTYSVSIELTGLDYQSSYTFQAKAIDKVATIETKEKRVKTTPVFDWGENDFEFNVPVKFNAGFSGLIDLVYPIGSIYLSANTTDPETLFSGTKWKQLKGRFLLGAGAPEDNTDSTFGALRNNSYNFQTGAKGGQYTHTLTVDQMPYHNHGATSTYSGANFYVRHGASAGTANAAAGTNTSVETGVGATWGNGFQTATYSHQIDRVNIGGTVSTSVGYNGSGASIANMPPYLVVSMWQRIS